MASLITTFASSSLRLITPTGRLSAVVIFLFLLVAIHSLSLAIEYGLTGGFIYHPLVRFLITAGAGSPFVAVALYGFTVARRARSSLKALALTDALTGLPNRRAFFARIEQTTSGTQGYLVILDADRFKAINDTLGHDAGDRALVAIAHRMKSLTSDTVYFARIGGEEFGALITGPDLAASLTAIETRVCRDVHYDLDGDRPVQTVSLSAGAVLFKADRGLPDVLRMADATLYQSKAAGGARLTVMAHLDPVDRPRPVHQALSEAI